jgi:hypothetical protein
MTFNLSLLTPDFAICAVDRRLTTPGKIVTERSNKLTLFDFADGHGFITYTGIGWDSQERTPSDWIADIPGLGRLSIDDAAAAIKADTERRLAQIARSRPDIRHSFVMGGFKLGIPFALLISNYDSFDGPERPGADPSLSISGKEMNLSRDSPHPYLVFATGAKPHHPGRIKQRLLPAIKDGASSKTLLKLVVKTVKDIAYQDDRKASVGSSVQSAVIGRYGSGDVMGHVPGGTTLLEGPNLISGDMKFANFYVDVSGDPQWRYDPALGKARIAETVCENCRSPVPEGYRLCGVCDAPSPHWTAGPR